MGLDRTAAEILCAAKSLGADFTNSAMLGRQNFGASPAIIDEIATLVGASNNGVAGSPYAEPFFKMLGADSILSVDASDYEGATIIHDLNAPLPAEHRGKFSLLFDGGSLEHVFNMAEALRSCMDILAVGGTFVQVNNANNFMGHGFWQFSPELLYRVFSPENGFRMQAVFLQELPIGPSGRTSGQYVYTRDPETVAARVMLVNRRPTYIAIIARKVADVRPFASWPQQSDYVPQWQDGQPVADPVRPSTTRRLLNFIRSYVHDDVERAFRPRYSYKAFVPMSRRDVMTGKIPA